ncbi:MAG: hypothetical protein CR984_02170 [Proteobacteria bacterium]|nr:MAG: hypothetical protein CR984_02170 [Pseudomonadota bacterium]PIE67288.1 MAG: hypothetical protein CSA23_04835 [Deltaproteobacteria bacterium]
MKWSTNRRCFMVDRHQIGFVKFILDAYDNMATVTTLDARQAIIQVAMAPGCEALVLEIMQSLPVTPVDSEKGTISAQ